MIGWIYIFGLVSLLVTFLCVFIRGADERCLRSEPKPDPSIERTAQIMLDEYHAQMRAGGEPHFPHWADDIVRSKK